MATLPAPKNRAVTVAKIVLEKLIEGLGVDIAVIAATAEAPWLATPIVKQLFRFFVERFASFIDENSFKFAAKLIIRFQSEGRLAEFETAMAPIKKGTATDEDLKRARDAIDRLGNRNRP